MVMNGLARNKVGRVIEWIGPEYGRECMIYQSYLSVEIDSKKLSGGLSLDVSPLAPLLAR